MNTNNQNKDQSANKDQSMNKDQSSKSPMAANEASANKSPTDSKAPVDSKVAEANAPQGKEGQAKDQTQTSFDAEAQAKKAKDASKNAA